MKVYHHTLDMKHTYYRDSAHLMQNLISLADFSFSCALLYSCTAVAPTPASSQSTVLIVFSSSVFRDSAPQPTIKHHCWLLSLLLYIGAYYELLKEQSLGLGDVKKLLLFKLKNWVQSDKWLNSSKPQNQLLCSVANTTSVLTKF